MSLYKLESVGIGIDLGTTNTVAAIFDGKNQMVVKNNRGSHMTSSVVSFTKRGVIVGDQAMDSTKNISNTVFDAKRMMGLAYADIQSFTDHWPFKVYPNEKGKICSLYFVFYILCS